jgi:hypothetical protein
MARVNNLSNFLTDVANAIKTKKGSETAIPAANFDTEILALPSQGIYEQRVLNISANGTQTITPSSGFDAIDELELTVAVPEKQLQSKTYNFTQNTTIQLLPDTGYDGFDTVTLNINVPSSQINNQNKTVTQNGTYTADSGYTGLGEVTVNVSQQMQCFENKQTMETWLLSHYDNVQDGDKAVVYGELKIYPIAPGTAFNSIYLPEEIVLDEAITSSIALSSNYGHWNLSPTQFYGNLRGGGLGFVSAYYTYNSEDGITYTRTAAPSIRNMGSTIVFAWNEETKLLTSTYDLSYTTTDLSKVQPFFQTYLPTYDGLYEIEHIDSKIAPLVVQPIQDVLNNSIGTPTRAYIGNTDWSSYCDMFGIKTGTTNYMGYECDTFDVLYYGNNYPISILNYDGKIRFGYWSSYKTSDASGSSTYTWYTIQNGIREQHSTQFDLPSQTYKYVSGNYTYAFCELFSTNDTTNCRLLQTYSSCRVYTTLSNTYTTVNRNSGYSYTVNIPQFAVCETQMTLNNVSQLLPGVTGYGKNQSYTGDGSIYNHLDQTEVNTRLFNLTINPIPNRNDLYVNVPTLYQPSIYTIGKVRYMKNDVEKTYIAEMLKYNYKVTQGATLRYSSIVSQILDNDNEIIISLQYDSENEVYYVIYETLEYTFLYEFLITKPTNGFNGVSLYDAEDYTIVQIGTTNAFNQAVTVDKKILYFSKKPATVGGTDYSSGIIYSTTRTSVKPGSNESAMAFRIVCYKNFVLYSDSTYTATDTNTKYAGFYNLNTKSNTVLYNSSATTSSQQASGIVGINAYIDNDNIYIFYTGVGSARIKRFNTSTYNLSSDLWTYPDERGNSGINYFPNEMYSTLYTMYREYRITFSQSNYGGQYYYELYDEEDNLINDDGVCFNLCGTKINGQSYIYTYEETGIYALKSIVWGDKLKITVYKDKYLPFRTRAYYRLDDGYGYNIDYWYQYITPDNMSLSNETYSLTRQVTRSGKFYDTTIEFLPIVESASYDCDYIVYTPSSNQYLVSVPIEKFETINNTEIVRR